MKILKTFPVLIITCLLVIAAEKKTACETRCAIRCDRLHTISATHMETGKNLNKRPFNFIYEKDIVIRFIPFYSKFY